MFWIDLRRIIRSGLINFKRGGVVSLASVLVMTVTLGVITSLIFLQALLHFSLSEIQDKVDVTVYFVPGAQESQILELQESIDKLPEVALSEYVSAEEAIAKFRERHKDDYLTLQALDELDENPLGAALNVKALEVSQYENIANFLEGDTALAESSQSIIDKVNYHQNKLIINRLESIIESAQRLGYFITLVLVLVSIVITFNTIRLAIHISREEISIMNLVGATGRYIRGPFMVSGIIYGLVASVITMLIFYPITLWLGNSMASFLGMNLFKYYIGNFFQIFLIIVFAGTLLGAISSFIATRKYLGK